MPTAAAPSHPDRLQLLARCFADCFADSHNTALLGGAAEPLYQPAQESSEPHRLYYREDYFSSALHEVAHWCIAGARRRRQVDFGYWYAPDGRSAEQQQAFHAVEYRPQALEWFFSRASHQPFTVSADNLDGNESTDDRPFRENIQRQILAWQDRGLPRRAGIFYEALAEAFGQPLGPSQLSLDAAELGL